jgi:hypothetical protein
MKKKLWMFFVCVMSLVFQVNAHEANAESSTTEVMSSLNSLEDPQVEELSFLVSLKDLDCSEENISIHVGGHSYAVRSLKKQGNQWIAKVSNDKKFRCPWGHPLCSNENYGCGQCHIRICPVYQPRTSHCQ